MLKVPAVSCGLFWTACDAQAFVMKIKMIRVGVLLIAASCHTSSLACGTRVGVVENIGPRYFGVMMCVCARWPCDV